MVRRLIMVCIVILWATAICHPQVAVQDTAAVHDSSAAGIRVGGVDTLHVVPNTKSTWLAMLCSAALPGAGQFYNESYWKVPIALGLGVYFASEFLRNNRLVDDYRRLYLETGETRYLNKREEYKSYRDENAWYFFIVYALNILDAYVDASLYNFDVSPTLTLGGPAPNVGLSLRLTW